MVLGCSYIVGLGARYYVADNWSLEAKAQYDDGVIVLGGRSYSYFDAIAGVYPFIGIEGDYLKFKGIDSLGGGMAVGLFVGGEYFMRKHLTLQLDFGPDYIFLTDQETSINSGDVSYVANIGLNYYFGE